MSTPRGRKRIRRPTYESTFLSGQTDHSASTSGTATQSETVPESQSQERSPAASAPRPPWVPPAPYVPPPHAAEDGGGLYIELVADELEDEEDDTTIDGDGSDCGGFSVFVAEDFGTYGGEFGLERLNVVLKSGDCAHAAVDGSLSLKFAS
ncbi:hypothetical protein Bca52824_010316 [Brassica carinata]|uniref:Uncharacterized protein n=1 Tax=Brassica carinata TaxID=52824 RepID=A0A8X7WBD1_BRACI|nr:hypothetical protein Bca52824_010316 [Brassica carinata]